MDKTFVPRAKDWPPENERTYLPTLEDFLAKWDGTPTSVKEFPHLVEKLRARGYVVDASGVVQKLLDT